MGSWWYLNRFKGGLLSHSHLDHIAGMIIATQVNMGSHKRWFMNRENLQNQIDHVFNEAVWPPIAGPGRISFYQERAPKAPKNGILLKDIPDFPSKFGIRKKYNSFFADYLNLLHHAADETSIDINGASIRLENHNGKTLMADCAYIVEEFPINHGKVARSSAFLITHPGDPKGQAMMFLEILAPTSLNKLQRVVAPSANLRNIWENIAPLKKQDRISTIFIEVAFDVFPTKNEFLLGLFRPRFVIEELIIIAWRFHYKIKWLMVQFTKK
eukprot:TRINITY_DN4121_c0_g1_i1.p1 TRINITY_DN4121_c0_g1~~TRINITY_DN4121_c0_g1_i1.p1  ORF type:complete len:270 (+),score=16.87 TRINITY_DN4121_c0_g1_i1:27-836(+)